MIGSAPVAEDAKKPAHTRTLVATLCGASAHAIGLATWAILDGRLHLGGGVALAAGIVLVIAGILASRTRDARPRLLVSFADRAFDGALLAATAWTFRVTLPAASAGALVALASGFLAAYVRARGSALGYLVEEGAGTRAIRVGLVATALLAGWTEWALFAVAAWMLLVTLVRVSQVAKEERV